MLIIFEPLKEKPTNNSHIVSFQVQTSAKNKREQKLMKCGYKIERKGQDIKRFRNMLKRIRRMTITALQNIKGKKRNYVEW